MMESVKNINAASVPMEGAKQKGIDAQHERELRRACRELESFFLLHLWRAMRATVPGEKSTSLNYAEMFDMNLADYLSRTGRFGLGEMLFKQLSRPESFSQPSIHSAPGGEAHETAKR